MKRLNILIISFVFAFSSCDDKNDENQREQYSTPSGKNEINMCSFDLINSLDDLDSKPDAAIIDWPQWKIGQTIKIKFLNGDVSVQEKVKEYANEWLKYANLKFEYVPVSEYADIRIGFNMSKEQGGNWSQLGMNSTSWSSNYQLEPSMHYGWIKIGNEQSARSSVLHEFGHALGLIHETTSPAANIKWNLPKVYNYYSELNGWDKETVDLFVVTKRNAESHNFSEYDPLSIMHYFVDKNLTLDGVGVPANDELSITDKKYINKWYPFPIVSVLESGQSIIDLPWNKRIKSPNGKYSLEFNDGLLQILDLNDNNVIWQAGDYNYRRKPSCYFELTTGNIIIKGARVSTSATIVTWKSNTSGFPGAKLYLQDDGELQLIHNGIVRWSSKTGKI